MAKVIDLDSRRGAVPTCKGTVVCVGCKHRWEHQSSIKEKVFYCPACKLCKGVRLGLYMPETDSFECECGYGLFYVLKGGVILCPSCGDSGTLPLGPWHA